MTNRFQGRLRLMTSGLFQIQSSFKVIIFITKYHENVSSMTHIPNGKPNIKTYSSKKSLDCSEYREVHNTYKIITESCCKLFNRIGF
jgi:hypothetical protein